MPLGFDNSGGYYCGPPSKLGIQPPDGPPSAALEAIRAALAGLADADELELQSDVSRLATKIRLRDPDYLARAANGRRAAAGKRSPAAPSLER